jgi:hypothetical protein
MRQILEKRNFYKAKNIEKIEQFVNCYEALCSTCYDPTNQHKCWIVFMKELDYEMNLSIIQVKDQIDKTIERLTDRIESYLTREPTEYLINRISNKQV